MTAAELLASDCPFFIKWLNGKEATKRQARKFLQEYPQYKVVREA